MLPMVTPQLCQYSLLKSEQLDETNLATGPKQTLHGRKVTEKRFTPNFFNGAGRFLRLNSQDIALY